MKKYFAIFLGTLFIFPTQTIAINPSYFHKSQSIGGIFRETFGKIFITPFFHFQLNIILILLALGAVVLGHFLHRKYFSYLFLATYPIFFIVNIVINSDKNLSDILQSNITLLYFFLWFTLIGFIASTIFNLYKKRKPPFSNRDYIPIAIIVGLAFILTFLPIRSGHLVCKTPLLKNFFNCDYYLEEAQGINQGWFTY